MAGPDPVTDLKRSPPVRARLLHSLLILWMAVILFLYWVAQGSPGVPFAADLTEPLRNIMQQFFSAPFLG